MGSRDRFGGDPNSKNWERRSIVRTLTMFWPSGLTRVQTSPRGPMHLLKTAVFEHRSAMGNVLARQK